MSDYYFEYDKMTEELSKLQEKLKKCLKGNLRRRLIRGREYYYLQYREGKHVKSRYVKADDAERLSVVIEGRKELEKQERELKSRLKRYSKMLGIHNTYRPVRNVDYDKYTLFMSAVAHDYKRMDPEEFAKKYEISRYRGLCKRYLGGFMDYINGIDRHNIRKTNDLVLDPYTYHMYFKYGKKEILDEELRRAIPAFLNRGLLITNIQEAVSGTSGN